jgi:membrane fusion protein YbhG
MSKRIVPVVLLILIAAAVYFFVLRKRGDADQLAASGTVEATEAALGFGVPGQIERVGPHEGDRVKAGDELGVLRHTELDARKAQAFAALAAARATLQELEAGNRSEEVAQAREAARAAAERYADAKRDFDRTRRLLEGGAVSQEALDKAKMTLEVTTAQRDQANQQLEMMEKGVRPERVAAQRAAVAQARAALEQVDAEYAQVVIRAPFAGVVTVRDREPGETVGAGAPVLTLMNLDDRWVRIYIREDRIGALKMGAAATITADTYPGKTYGGAVAFIASEAEFTPRNVQTTEERVKLVYAVKVRITGDPTNELKPGMAADVTLSSSAK